MLKLINKNYSQYHVLKESQTLYSGTNQTGVNQGRNLTSQMPSLSSNFQKTWSILKDKEGTR